MKDMAIAVGLILVVIVIGMYGCCAFDRFDDREVSGRDDDWNGRNG